MSHHNFETKLNLYLRSERTLFKIALREKSRQFFYIAMAIVTLLATLIFFNISLYHVVLTHYSAQLSAALLGLLNLLLTVIILAFSRKKKRSSEAKDLSEIRDFAKKELLQDIQSAKQDITDIGSSIHTITSDIRSLFSGATFSLQCLLAFYQHMFHPKKDD